MFVPACVCPQLLMLLFLLLLLLCCCSCCCCYCCFCSARFAHIVKLSSQKLPLSRNILHGMQMKWNYFSAEFLLDLRSERLMMIKRIAFIVFAAVVIVVSLEYFCILIKWNWIEKEKEKQAEGNKGILSGSRRQPSRSINANKWRFQNLFQSRKVFNNCSNIINALLPIRNRLVQCIIVY